MWSFIALYGILRFMIEFWKLPDEGIGYILGLTLGQWLCVPMFVVGGIMLFYVSKKGM
jgi:phosphatidylglycerol---prolipoprotein diacylglyceryl transferase